MPDSIAYTSVPSKDIRAGLKGLVASSAEASEFGITISDNHNVIIFTSSSPPGQHVTDMFRVATGRLAGRIFLVVEDEQVEQISTAIAIACQQVTSTEKVCSGLIRISSAPKNFAAVSSVLSSNSVTGRQSELYLPDPSVSESLALEFLEHVDQVVLDSRLFIAHCGFLGRLLDTDIKMVDLEWIRLADWRGEIKDVFGKPEMAERLGSLSSVKLTYSEPEPEMAPWLLAGWIAEVLELEVRSLGAYGFDCFDGEGRAIELHLSKVEDPVPGLREVEFAFNGASKELSGEVRIIRGERFETFINCGESFHWLAPCVDTATEACLSRYYSVGVGLDRYKPGLARGLELLALKRGFLVEK